MARRFWTEEENQFIRENFPYYGSRHCAEKLDRAITAVQKQAQKLGVKYGSQYFYISSEGYIVLEPKHGIALLLHRAMMELKLGRKLDTDELVHHKDGNKMNNHPDNLELTDRSEHAKTHRCDKTHRFVAEPQR